MTAAQVFGEKRSDRQDMPPSNLAASELPILWTSKPKPKHTQHNVLGVFGFLCRQRENRILSAN